MPVCDGQARRPHGARCAPGSSGASPSAACPCVCVYCGAAAAAGAGACTLRTAARPTAVPRRQSTRLEAPFRCGGRRVGAPPGVSMVHCCVCGVWGRRGGGVVVARTCPAPPASQRRAHTPDAACHCPRLPVPPPHSGDCPLHVVVCVLHTCRCHAWCHGEAVPCFLCVLRLVAAAPVFFGSTCGLGLFRCLTYAAAPSSYAIVSIAGTCSLCLCVSVCVCVCLCVFLCACRKQQPARQPRRRQQLQLHPQQRRHSAAGRPAPLAVALLLVCCLVSVPTAFGQCPNACNLQGTCNPDMTCTCDEGWEGPDCSIRTSASTSTSASLFCLRRLSFPYVHAPVCLCACVFVSAACRAMPNRPDVAWQSQRH